MLSILVRLAIDLHQQENDSKRYRSDNVSKAIVMPEAAHSNLRLICKLSIIVFQQTMMMVNAEKNTSNNRHKKDDLEIMQRTRFKR